MSHDRLKERQEPSTRESIESSIECNLVQQRLYSTYNEINDVRDNDSDFMHASVLPISAFESNSLLNVGVACSLKYPAPFNNESESRALRKKGLIRTDRKIYPSKKLIPENRLKVN